MRKEVKCLVVSSVMMIGLLAFQPGLSRAQAPASKPTAAPMKAGMLTNYGGVVVRNLPVGKTVSMKQLSNLPLVIQNLYPRPIYVSIQTAKPVKLFEDYESIPDPSWVKVEASGVTVPAKGEVKLDVVISIPNQESLMGRKFQTNLEIKTLGMKDSFINFGVHNTDKLFFSVAAIRDEQALKDALAKPRDTAFDFVPARIDFYHITAGQKVEVKDDGRDVVLQNTSDKTQTYYLSALQVKGSLARPDEGSQPANPNDILISPEEVTLKAGETKKLKITVQVPAGINLGKGPLFCLVSAKSGLTNWAEKYFRVVLHAGAKPEGDPAMKKGQAAGSK